MKKKVFLVDYENVAEDGMSGFSNLDTADEVYIFYTEKNKRIGLDVVEKWLAAPDRANVFFMKVTSGKQALDIQLATFLGSLVINADSEKEQFFIVSKDKGYEHIIRFWQGRLPQIRVSRISSLQDTGRAEQHQPVQHAESAKGAEADAAPAVKNITAEGTSESTPESKTAPESSQKPAKKVRTKKTGAVKQQESSKKAEAAEQNGPEDRTGDREEAAGQTEAVKPAAPEKKNERAAEPAASGKSTAQNTEGSAEEHQEPTLSQRKNDLNNRVLQVLSKAKFDNKTAGQAASLVAGFCGRENAKRDIYTAIVKLFGQKKGLEIYRCIKGTI